jgi:hypothetical protein
MQKVDPLKERLEETIHNLGEATRNKDWSTLGEMDIEARQAIEAALATGTSPSEEVQRLLSDLQSLYQEMISACQLERDHIQDQLMASRKRQEAVGNYQQSRQQSGKSKG